MQQPLAHAVTKPELRSTAMALMEFTQGAFASVVIILFGNFANRYGLTNTLLILSVGFWSVALVLTTFYYFVYPREAAAFRQEMKNRRAVLIRQSQIPDLPESERQDAMIEIHEWNGEGYKPLVFTPQWMAAILNWQPLYDLANADEIEVHQQTDEVFVLWRGRGALYYLAEDGQLEVQDLQPGVIYNVPAGVWHGCLGTREVSWIIVENRDTHLNDTTVRKMSESERNALHEKAPAWCRA